jgi:gag-polypeptide of LTR copia-type
VHAEALLIKHGNWDHVNGTNPKPTGNDTDQKVLDWITADRDARADLLLAISPSEVKHVKDCPTARSVWLKLEEIHRSKGTAIKAIF